MGEYLNPRNPDSFRELRFLYVLFTLFVCFGLHPIFAQEEEGEAIIWGEDEEGIDEDFFGDDDEFFDESEDLEGDEFEDDEFGDDEFGDELDEFLEEEEPIEDLFIDESIEEAPLDMGYAIRLSASSPSFVNNTLMTWNSLVDVRFGADLPFNFQLGPLKMRVGAEVVTYKFVNYMPEGGEFSGVGIYGMVTFPAGPSDMHAGVGFLGSSPGLVIGQSFGIPYTDEIMFKMGTRATIALNLPDQLKESGSQATWFEAFLTVVYKLGS